MGGIIPEDRVILWAWIAWRDAVRKWNRLGKHGPMPTRPAAVTAYINSHPGGIPKSWWARYLIHIGTPIKPPNPPVPVPHPANLNAHVQNIIFGAQNPLAALGAPARFGVALTADPAYAAWATLATVAALRLGGHRVYSWGVQTQIPASWMVALKDRLGLDGVIYQSETEDELLTGLDAGGQLFVGNPNSWPSRIPRWNALVLAGEAAMTFEVYTNDGGPWPDGASSAGALIASECIGCYASQAGDPQPSDYKAHTPPGVWANICVYHAAGVTEGWGAL